MCSAHSRTDHSSSGDTVARIYNLSLRGDPHPSTVPLSSEMVWDSFWLYGLLLSSMRFREPLVVPHSGDHHDRWTAALTARNQLMAGTGQPAWSHACDQCEQVIYTEQEGSGRVPAGTFFYASATACYSD